MNRYLGRSHPILKGNMVKHYRTGSGLPQRPQRCKFFAGGQITDLGRRLGGEDRNFVLVPS